MNVIRFPIERTRRPAGRALTIAMLWPWLFWLGAAAAIWSRYSQE
jgi:hypothetical protein